MKEKIEKVVFIIGACIIVLLSISFLLKKPMKFSEFENRYLQQVPKFSVTNLLNGRYVKDIEDYINDQFPLRNTLVGIKSQSDILLGKTKINDIYISDNRLIPAFLKNNNTDKILSTLNNFVNTIDVPSQLMLVPNAIEIYKEQLPINDELNDGLIEIENIYSNFEGDTIDVSKKFFSIKDDVNLYYKTDHHWTTYGAFYAYNEYLKANGKSEKELEDYNVENVTDEFYGTSYSKANYYNLDPDCIHLFKDNNKYNVKYVIENIIDDSLYNYDYLNKKDKYSIFLDNNHALIEIINENINSDEHLLVIKNSYGNSLVPFLSSDFKKTSVIDLRYYKDDVSNYIKENSVNKVLIIYDINGIYTDASIFKLK